jgi:hypothetical protein
VTDVCAATLALVLAHWAPTGCPANATIDTDPRPIRLYYSLPSFVFTRTMEERSFCSSPRGTPTYLFPRVLAHRPWRNYSIPSRTSLPVFTNLSSTSRPSIDAATPTPSRRRWCASQYAPELTPLEFTWSYSTRTNHSYLFQETCRADCSLVHTWQRVEPVYIYNFGNVCVGVIIFLSRHLATWRTGAHLQVRERLRCWGCYYYYYFFLESWLTVWLRKNGQSIGVICAAFITDQFYRKAIKTE